MQITGKNLTLVRTSLDWAMDELRGQIASCPDVFAYAREIEDLEDQIEDIRILKFKVDLAYQREHPDAVPKV